jgi:wyosine [tRNA(Phe)-imidazoG37] synthetase (radical SAM superfamily)
MVNSFQYLYGPVHSWRLGRSLGIDPLSNIQKTCNMDCAYCQLGKTVRVVESRKEFVPTPAIMEEIRRLPLHFVDYLTFSGRGEPTLASNLGAMIRRTKACRKERVAVITNSSLLYREDVQDDLKEADFVLAKLDASNPGVFHAMGGGQLDFETVLDGLRQFRKKYRGKFALQIMLINQNLTDVAQLAGLASQIGPDEVQLNTPLRPCGVAPISALEMRAAKKFFHGLPVLTVWDAPHQEYTPLDQEATIKRHGNFIKTRHAF